MSHSQSPFRVRTEWGAAGAVACLPGARTAVVIDVLSFTTTACLAVARGIAVLPTSPGEEEATAYAEEQDAELAQSRLQARVMGTMSLSPESIISAPADTLPERLVLPSPNGATISGFLHTSGAEVLIAALSNADAVGAELAKRLDENPDAAVLIVPSGERWSDGSLRPAVEDLWGAGAVISAIRRHAESDLTGQISPESLVAEGAFAAVRDDLTQWMLHCSSGRELTVSDYERDVTIAADLDVIQVVPVLRDSAFVDLHADSAG